MLEAKFRDFQESCPSEPSLDFFNSIHPLRTLAGVEAAGPFALSVGNVILPGIDQTGVVMRNELTGLRVLLVEDSPVVAMATGDILDQIGCVTVGPAANMATALELAEQGEFDAAIVDLNIRGSKTFTLLKILERRGIPYLICSGYADWTMPEEFAERPRLPKPFGADLMREKLTDLIVIPDSRNGDPAT